MNGLLYLHGGWSTSFVCDGSRRAESLIKPETLGHASKRRLWHHVCMWVIKRSASERGVAEVCIQKDIVVVFASMTMQIFFPHFHSEMYPMFERPDGNVPKVVGSI